VFAVRLPLRCDRRQVPTDKVIQLSKLRVAAEPTVENLLHGGATVLHNLT